MSAKLSVLFMLVLSACDDRPCVQACHENCYFGAAWYCTDRFDSYKECVQHLQEYETLEPSKKWRCIP